MTSGGSRPVRGRLIVDCGVLTGVSETVASAARSTSGWWIPIGILALFTPILVALAVTSPPDAYTSLLMAPFSPLGGVLALLSPLFARFDRRYLEGRSEWTPSGWYYWMIFPALTPVLSIVYVYRRHEHVGVP